MKIIVISFVLTAMMFMAVVLLVSLINKLIGNG